MLELKPFGEKAYNFAFRHPSKDARINILEGAVRSSKTVAMLVKMPSLLRYDVGGRKLISGVSKQTIYQNVLCDLFDLLGQSNCSYNRQTGALRLCGDEWLVVGAKDEGSEKYIRGVTLGIAYVDEGSLIPRSYFLMLLNRLSREHARLYVTTNPDNPMHYLKTEFLDNEALRAQGDIWSEHFSLNDNPNLSKEYIRFVKRAYTGIFYKRFIKGEWVRAEGAVYAEAFTDDVLFDDSTTPIGLGHGYTDRYIGVDYGTTNPCVFLDIMDDGQIWWVVDEYYYDSAKEMKQKTDSEYADDLERFINRRAGGYAQVVMDPSAASFREELQRRSILVIEGDNEVIDGIRLVSVMFQRGLLRVHKRCTNTIREHLAYGWDGKKAERGVEEPLKQKDHTCDALRYPVKTKFDPWRLVA